MDRLHQHRAPSGLDVDIAQRPHRHPAARIEPVQQPFGGAFTELLTDHPKELRIHRFQLEVGPVADAAAASHVLRPTSFERLANQGTPGRQRLMDAGGDFTQRDRIGTVRSRIRDKRGIVFSVCPTARLGFPQVIGMGVERDNVAAIGNFNLGVVRFPLNRTTLVHVDEFGVQRAAEQMKRQFGDFGANREHWSESEKERSKASRDRVAEPSLYAASRPTLKSVYVLTRQEYPFLCSPRISA